MCPSNCRFSAAIHSRKPGGAGSAIGIKRASGYSDLKASLSFGDGSAKLREALRSEYPEARLIPMADPAPPGFREWIAALNRQLEGHIVDFRLPVHVRATAFQMKVWKYLQSISHGSVQSYLEGSCPHVN